MRGHLRALDTTPTRPRRFARATAALSVTGMCALGLVGCSSGPTRSVPTTSRTTSPKTTQPLSAPTFGYGFDLSNQEPGSAQVKQDGVSVPESPAAASSAQRVLAKFAGSYVDQSIYGFGANADPEPEPGVYDMSSIASRISLITSEGGVPVISLYGAPGWMRSPSSANARQFEQPPSPDHYQDFAALAAHVATSFPQVKYFVVWNELKGFWDPSTHSWNYQAYTEMYNDVYEAIKNVRPEDEVGGPYAVMSAEPQPVSGVVSTVKGPFGYLDQDMLEAVTYWLANKVGADFIAVDGATENAKVGNQVVNPVTAAEQYAVVDAWIRSQTDLPIWWMESHIQPKSGWSQSQAAAARVATLAEMSSSGASVGMQWQPQEQSGWPDEGLWTSTLSSGGGQPTPLASVLSRALPVIERDPVLAPGEPAGVLVASDSAGGLAVNTTGETAFAHMDGTTVRLEPGQVLVR